MRNLIRSFALLALVPAWLSANTLVLPNFKDVAKKVRPSVVNLSIVKNIKVGGFQSFQRDPFFRQFFGRNFDGDGQEEAQGEGGGTQSVPQNSLGSGVIIDAEKGYILTNNHVVDGADGITVKLADKRELAGEVVGRDPKTDLAVVKLKKPAPDLVALSFGDSDAMDVGDWVLAIGSPFGLEQTVSHGIISARGRVIGDGPYDDFLQTDAPINPGNSGGPLVNLDGEVIGINTAITTRSGGSEGIGFAIPSNLARKVYRDLASVGHVTRGWLGISIQDVDGPLAKHFGLAAGTQGALVGDVMEGGPAKAAGLKSGDVIQAFDGKPVDSVRELQRMVADSPVGGQRRAEDLAGQGPAQRQPEDRQHGPDGRLRARQRPAPRRGPQAGPESPGLKRGRSGRSAHPGWRHRGSGPAGFACRRRRGPAGRHHR